MPGLNEGIGQSGVLSEAQQQATNASVPNGKAEISLSTLQPAEVEKIMKAFQQGRDIANNYYTAKVEPKIIRRKDIYNATQELYRVKFPKLSELNNWVSRDVKTTIDWIMPSLLEVFTGTDDPVSVVGVNVEDDEKAELIQQLMDYFITKKNSFFTFFYNFAREGLVTNFAVAKAWWRREEERQPMVMMADAAIMQELLIGAQQGIIELKGATPITPEGDLLKVEFDVVSVKANYPVLENMSSSELRFTPESRDLHSAKYVAHRKIVHGDYLKRKEQDGTYENVDKAMMEAAGDVRYTVLDRLDNDELDGIARRLSDGDNASKEFELYEAYLKVDYNNDGVYEDIIVHAVGNTPLKIQDNSFGMPPFFIFSPESDPNKIFSDSSFADVLEQLQDLKTALVRQMVIATAKTNRPQFFVDDRMVDMDALCDGDEYVPVDAQSSNVSAAIYVPPAPNMSPYTMSLIEYAQNEIESQSGSTRYNQGLDSNSLNKTATGINAILGQADKKVRLLARVLAETAWIPLLKFLIVLCQKFVDDGQVVRLTNQNVPIRREDLNIDYDLVVNVGQGAGTREAQIQYLMLIIAQLYPQLSQVGLVNENSWYNIVKELLNNMGIHAEKYVLDPQSQEFQAQKAQAQQQQVMAMQQQQAAMQQQAAIKQAELQIKADEVKARNMAKLSATFDQLPLDAKVQALEQIGIKTTLDSVASKEAADRAAGGGYYGYRRR
jgi:hypothetical protein